ncbi:MAG TPA: chromosome segregation protein SMC, partial [Candidatus Obscuribacterales bacterium]|nr:chromosome segregation protein SMC [Candidatus Obscuribacterales bacterium]
GKGSAYRVENEVLANFREVRAGRRNEPFKLLDRRRSVARIFDAEEKAFTAPEESVKEDETLLSVAGGPFTNNRLISSFQQNLASWSIFHDLHVNRKAAIRQPTVARFEKRLSADAQNLISVLHTLYTGDREFESNVNLAMRAAFGSDFDKLVFPPAADQRIQLRVRWKTLKTEQSAADLSDGTLRFLFLLAALANPNPSPLIAIDEPETGLHPSMMPILAEHATDAARRSQVIFTTHSAQLLNYFSEAPFATTVTKWSNGETRLAVLDRTDLAKWLEEYSLGSLFESGELELME